MGVERLEFGSSLSGLLVDGVDGTPYVGATIRMTKDKGIVVEVPYLPDRGIAQFDHVQEWFGSRTPPNNMLLLTHEGAISLFDITWSGHSETWGGSRASVGSLRPTLAVLSRRDAELAAPLVMNEMHSWADGLNEWSSLSSVRTERETDEQARVQSVTMTLDASASFTWSQGDARLTLRAGWLHAPERNGYERKTTVHDNVAIVSTFESGPAPFWDHFVEHRKVANLLVFLFGRQLSFRKHCLRDDLFTTRAGGGRVISTPLTEVISRNSYRERIAEVPSVKELGNPIAGLHEIGEAGLESWANNYEAWKRFILPSASILGRSGVYLEDLVISTSMSMEAAGGIIGERPGERVTWTTRGTPRPTTATYVYRCLDVLAVQWPERVGDRVGLSKAIANAYNDVKHYDRGDFPEHDEVHVVSEISQMIVRLLVLHIAGRADELLSPYRESEQFYKIKQALDAYELRLDEDGKWIRNSD